MAYSRIAGESNSLCQFIICSLAGVTCTVLLQAQTACVSFPVVQQQICATQSVFVGTQTDIGYSYTWFREGSVKVGPVTGNGGALSFPFALNRPEDGGEYTIERLNPDNTVSCQARINAVYVVLPLVQTMTGGPLCNGETVINLGGSETGVTYDLYRNSFEFIESSSGTGGPLNFSAIYATGTYFIEAYKNQCGASKIIFGNQYIANNSSSIIFNQSTLSSVNLGWPGTGNFIVEYGPPGFTPGNQATAGAGGTVSNGNSSPFNISGLTLGTRYDVYIRQNCSPGLYTLNSFVRTVSTDCQANSSFPYTQGFESQTPPALPACWTAVGLNNSNFVSGTLNYGAYAGTNSVRVDTGVYTILPLQLFNGNQRLKYFVGAGYYASSYQVRISTTNNAAASFTTLLFEDTVSTNNPTERIIDLSGLTGVVYIAFVAKKNYLFMDDFSIENIPACPGPRLVKLNAVASNAATISWEGAGQFILEYGPPGFTPGTGAGPGAGATLVNNAVSPFTINGLAAGIAYDVYLRQNCATNGYSINSPKINFTTFNLCTTTTVITACTDVTAVFTQGFGSFSFSGIYPNNSTGVPTMGKELLYSFTPPVSGVYYLDIGGSTGLAFANFLYRQASAVCSNTGWTGIHGERLSSNTKHPIGLLQGGVEYYILVDNEFEHAMTQTFKICKANVATPGFCSGATVNRPIPSFNPKKEYIIDNDGNLLAELDFGQVSNNLGQLNISYQVNTAAVRRDGSNKEYLDRNFSISSVNAPDNQVGVKLYFSNAELQRLASEPNDGVADVTGPGDLNISRTSNACGALIGSGHIILQAGNGNYDASSSFIQFITPGFSSFYLHGGAAVLEPADAVLCPGMLNLPPSLPGSKSFTMPGAGPGYSYQWQVNSGGGFTDLGNVLPYFGANTSRLTIYSPPSSLYGNQYRCIASNGSTTITSNVSTIKFGMIWNGQDDENWDNPGNWGCPLKIPDSNTDVFINGFSSFFPVVNNNAYCRSLWLLPNSTLTVNPGFRLNITK